jgi:uncharacterized protein (TIGR02996 family)
MTTPRTPRLAFADWLDENGDPNRAEFIRHQSARAMIDKADWFNTRRSALKQQRSVLDW